VFELFTHRARRSLVLAQDEAMALGHDVIGTGHMLLGLVASPESTAGAALAERGLGLPGTRAQAVRVLAASGIDGTRAQQAKDALSSLGIDVAQIKRLADDAFGPGAFVFPRPVYSPRARKVLELAVREARALGHEHIGTGHVLLGMIQQGEGVAFRVLTTLEVDTGALREDLLARASQEAFG